MAEVSILVVEDELIIAEDIKNQLKKLGYRTTGIAKSYQQALDALAQEIPDLAMVDIKLKGTKDGIDLVETIKKTFQLPVVFLTSHADKKTVARAKKVKPDGYLVKPFERDDLYTTIEIALSNFANSRSAEYTQSAFDENSQVINDSIFVKKDSLLVKIRFEELKWIRAERNYIELHCKDKMVLTRSTLKEILDKLPETLFMQVHRSYAVNFKFIEMLDCQKLVIDNEEIPVGRTFYEEIKQKLEA